ncbi:IclR family transcriptional regulator [Natranaerovirga hydrolytica]|uniref:IclR family transcriptional regulator n=1 Tax=Natranaerovirga hydrolytica TaxID=680378 RepID=A0A4R1M7R8_9FIRM|nr:IclR family transcriptional regulator [Natranaerovirga hydrolytica]TCK87975.1 IclR family transcriptional regulator [Natranaerovirga hydrolytica]
MRINRTSKRTIDILELISKNKKGLTLKEITRIMDIPQTSAFDILQTLLSMNLIAEKNETYKKYILGIKAYEIGMAYTYNNDIIQISIPYLEELGEKLGKTSFLGILDKDQVAYIYKYEPSNAVVTTAKIGSRNDIYSTSLGKVLLAYLEEEQQLELINTMQFTQKTKRTIDSKIKLLKEIEIIKEKGYGIDNRELEEYIFCIGAPVFDNKNKIIAAVSVTGLYKEDLEIEKEASFVIETAKNISVKMGNKNISL